MYDKRNIILIAIAILVVALVAVGAYIIATGSNNVTNDTVVGDNSTRNDTNTSNATYRVYNPQSDSYVTVIGEGYDDEVDRWYTYDTDGVRYYNTRIK